MTYRITGRTELTKDDLRLLLKLTGERFTTFDDFLRGGGITGDERQRMEEEADRYAELNHKLFQMSKEAK